jgi:hypothetical protein
VNGTASPPQCTRTLGSNAKAQAFAGAGAYYNQTGWDFQKISVIPGSVTDPLIPYAAGFLEGSLFVNETTAFWYNYKAVTSIINPLNASLEAFLNDHLTWVAENVKTNNSVYWQTVGWFYRQMEGFAAGYNSQNPPEPFTFMTVLLLNLQGDIWDIWSYISPPTMEELRIRNQKGSHCSSFIKWLPDGSDLYSSHTTWSSYTTLYRVFKIYNFTVNEWPGKTVLQSGYPLVISSVDDYYQTTETLLMSTETTLSVNNPSVYKAVTPHGLFAFLRAPLANRLATSAKDWTTLMGEYNSGTYNNQWIVVDYKLFNASNPLDPDTLWVSEQMPGFYTAASQTQTLEYGIFPSYNMAMYPETQVLAGMAAAIAQWGVSQSYDLAPRANIFRRDGNKAQSFSDAQSLLRYNNWKNDPLSGGNPWGAIAARGDLATTGYQAEGAIDGKITNNTLIRAGQVSIIAGPTYQQQPVFCWSTARPSVAATPHEGQPDCFDFDWLIVDQNLPCGYAN